MVACVRTGEHWHCERKKRVCFFLWRERKKGDPLSSVLRVSVRGNTVKLPKNENKKYYKNQSKKNKNKNKKQKQKTKNKKRKQKTKTKKTKNNKNKNKKQKQKTTKTKNKTKNNKQKTKNKKQKTKNKKQKTKKQKTKTKNKKHKQKTKNKNKKQKRFNLAFWFGLGLGWVGLYSTLATNEHTALHLNKSPCCWSSYNRYLRGAILSRTHHIHKNLYITLFLLIIFSSNYYVPP